MIGWTETVANITLTGHSQSLPHAQLTHLRYLDCLSLDRMWENKTVT